jgi:hypothetical protein
MITASTFLNPTREPTKLTTENLKYIVFTVMLNFTTYFLTAHVTTSRSGGGKFLGAPDRSVDCMISIASNLSKSLFRNVLGRIFVWSRYMRIYSVMIVNIKNLFAESYHSFITILDSGLIHFYEIPFSCFCLRIVFFNQIVFST